MVHGFVVKLASQVRFFVLLVVKPGLSCYSTSWDRKYTTVYTPLSPGDRDRTLPLRQRH